MPNCPRDGLHLCMFVGNAKSSESFYLIPGVNIGPGASGAPMTINHDANRNLGYLYSEHTIYFLDIDQSGSPIYSPGDFNSLLNTVSND